MAEIKAIASLISFVCSVVEVDPGTRRTQLHPGRLVTSRWEHVPPSTAPLLEFGLNFGAVFIQGCLSLCMWVLPATAEM